MSEQEEKEIAFIGKITAGITHEMKNVLAIIRESSGLMEDIMAISPEAMIKHQDKIQSSLIRIKDQINRGVILTDRLNKFAHSSDETIAKIDLNEMIEQLIELSQRFAGLKNVVLKTNSPEILGLSIITRPVLLQMALFTSIECCLDSMPAGGEINIFTKKKGKRNEVCILCEGTLPEKPEFARSISASEKWPALQEIAVSLGGSVTLDESAYGIMLVLMEEIR